MDTTAWGAPLVTLGASTEAATYSANSLTGGSMSPKAFAQVVLRK